MISAEEIRILREKKGWSQIDLAKAVGISQAAIGKIESGETKRSRYLHDIEMLLTDGSVGAVGELKRPASRPVPNAGQPRFERLGQGRIPILGKAAGGPSGRFIMNGERVGTTFTPPILEGIEDAYAVYVHGSSMEDRYYNGETVWIHPYLPVGHKDFVVAQILGEKDGDVLDAYVKQFWSRNSQELVLKQLNPGEGEDELMHFPESKVFSVHKIVFSGIS